jgi:hypothetical protein
MSDRATYLARTLLTRLQSLETLLAEEPGGREGSAAAARRRETIAKVLAIEVGLTDENSIRLVEGALPYVSPKERASERELTRFAAFLRERLGGSLTP